MNSHAKFRGAARRGFSVIYEKPPGGADIRPPPSVRGLMVRFGMKSAGLLIE